MEIFIHRNGQDQGPYSAQEVRDRLDAGRLASTDMAWHEGAAEWQPLFRVDAVNRAPAVQTLQVLPALPLLPAVRQSGQSAVRMERICPFCREAIQASAIKCRFCGEMLDEKFRSDSRADLGTVTTQRTSKPLKAQMLMCQMFLVGSICGTFVFLAANVPPLAALFALFFVASLVGIFVMRFRIWWHHG